MVLLSTVTVSNNLCHPFVLGAGGGGALRPPLLLAFATSAGYFCIACASVSIPVMLLAGNSASGLALAKPLLVRCLMACVVSTRGREEGYDGGLIGCSCHEARPACLSPTLTLMLSSKKVFRAVHSCTGKLARQLSR